VLGVSEMSELMMHRLWQAYVFPPLLSFMIVDQFTNSQ
jgi:hypothetical protein